MIVGDAITMWAQQCGGTPRLSTAVTQHLDTRLGRFFTQAWEPSQIKSMWCEGQLTIGYSGGASAQAAATGT